MPGGPKNKENSIDLMQGNASYGCNFSRLKKGPFQLLNNFKMHY